MDFFGSQIKQIKLIAMNTLSVLISLHSNDYFTN